MVQVRLGVHAARAVVVPERRAARVQRLQIGRRAPAQVAERALQRVLERFPEVAVEVRVDQRVQRRVEVADPEQHGHHGRRDVARLAAQRCDHVPAGKNQGRMARRFINVVIVAAEPDKSNGKKTAQKRVHNSGAGEKRRKNAPKQCRSAN